MLENDLHPLFFLLAIAIQTLYYPKINMNLFTYTQVKFCSEW